MTIIDRIRETIEALAYRSPIVIMTRKRQRAWERNAFTLGVDYGAYNASTPAASEKASA